MLFLSKHSTVEPRLLDQSAMSPKFITAFKCNLKCNNVKPDKKTFHRKISVSANTFTIRFNELFSTEYVYLITSYYNYFTISYYFHLNY